MLEPGGLPPRARGSPHKLLPLESTVGPTPACAGITVRACLPLTRIRAYPRVRGDHSALIASGAVSPGLPPRARGSPLPSAAPGASPRPTPACAGITAGPSGRKPPRSAYPRVRGDHGIRVPNRLGSLGLPPRARGSRHPRRASARRSGPTPACAGITTTPAPRTLAARAYPRVRGDHAVKVNVFRRSDGLPPRARGSPLPSAAPGASPRPTPACAGITAGPSGRKPPRSAYPRVRGDHGIRVPNRLGSLGLPPRARGSRHPRRASARRSGPTPACAGITTTPAPRTLAARAYPRVRGDHAVKVNVFRRSDGLPPRARGSRLAFAPTGPVHGPTPACAGITSSSRTPRPTRAAYPRVRGDHRTASPKRTGRPGLPPRRRGSLRRCADRAPGPRPTPACAGITPAPTRNPRA